MFSQEIKQNGSLPKTVLEKSNSSVRKCERQIYKAFKRQYMTWNKEKTDKFKHIKI